MTEKLVDNPTPDRDVVSPRLRATGIYADLVGQEEADAYFESIREAREENLRMARRSIEEAISRRSTTPPRSILL